MQIKRIELLKALQAVEPGLASKEIIEQSTSFVFKDGRVHSNNDVITVSHPVDAELEGAVKASLLLSYLNKSKDDELEITSTDKEFLIKGKHSKAGIVKQTEIKLPIPKHTKTWTKFPEDVTKAIKFALFSASDDMSRPALTGIHVKGKMVESSDNTRFTQVTLKKSYDTELLIPAIGCDALIRHNPTHIMADTNWTHFKNAEGTELSIRTLADKFPDLTKPLNRTWTLNINMPENMVEIIEGACVFLFNEKNKTNDDPFIEVSIKKK